MPFESAETSQPGVAQLVARVVWDHQVGGSSPSTRTKKLSEISDFRELFLFLVYCGARGEGE